MNHGKCINCWWFSENVCYFQSAKGRIHHVEDNSYCPDYINRKKDKDKLTETKIYKEVNNG